LTGIAAGVVTAAVAAGTVALLHSEAHPRFVASVTRVEVTSEECRALGTDTYGFGQDLAAMQCTNASHGVWFDVTVENLGDQEGFLKTCTVEGLDSSGRRVFKAIMSFFPIQWPPGPPVNAGESRTFRWYGLVVDPTTAREGSVGRYTTACPAVEYDGPVPV